MKFEVVQLSDLARYGTWSPREVIARKEAEREEKRNRIASQTNQ